MPVYRNGMYNGYNYEQASRRAEELTKIAARTGQTLRLYDHLAALSELMRRD